MPMGCHSLGADHGSSYQSFGKAGEARPKQRLPPPSPILRPKALVWPATLFLLLLLGIGAATAACLTLVNTNGATFSDLTSLHAVGRIATLVYAVDAHALTITGRARARRGARRRLSSGWER